MDNLIKEYITHKEILDMLIIYGDNLITRLNHTEAKIWIWLFINSYIKNNSCYIRIGYGELKEALDQGYGNGPCIKTLSRALFKLKEKGFLASININKYGTKYKIFSPESIAESYSIQKKDDIKRYKMDNIDNKEIFDRDKWQCQYCGANLTPMTATIDHFIPVCKSGGNEVENLKTCCLLCNSIKNDKTYEEAAPALLKSIKERRMNGIL